MSFFKSIAEWFKNLFSSLKQIVVKLDAIALNYAPKAVDFLQKIKAGIDTEEYTSVKYLVTALIPGDTDTKIIEFVEKYLREYLPAVCKSLEIVYDAAGKDTEVEQLQVILDAISNASEDTKTKVYVDLAATIAQQLSDGKLTFSEALIDTQLIYKHREAFGIA